VVCTLVAAVAMQVEGAARACVSLVALEAGTCAVQTDAVSIAGFLAHRLGAVDAVPSLEASTLGRTKGFLVSGGEGETLAVTAAVVGAQRDLTRQTSPQIITGAHTSLAHSMAITASGGMLLVKLSGLKVKTHTFCTSLSFAETLGTTCRARAVIASPPRVTVARHVVALLLLQQS